MKDFRKEARYLADDHRDFGRSWSPNPASGWWYDGRGAEPLKRNYAPYSISNIKGDAPTGMVRELQKTSSGVVTVVTSVRIVSGFDGLCIRLYDNDGNDAAYLYTKNGAYYALGKDQTDVFLAKEDEPVGVHRIRAALDFEKKTVGWYLDEKFAGTVCLTAKHIKFYRVGTLAGHILDVKMLDTVITADYYVNESLETYRPGLLPADFETEGNVTGDGNSLVLTAPAKMTRRFSAEPGKLCAETFFFMKELRDGASFSLTADGQPVVTFLVENKGFAVNGTRLRGAADEMWYRLRFELDPAGTVLVKINGKTLDVLPLTVNRQPDALVLSASEGTVLADRFRVFPLIDYEDYCPEPKIPAGMDRYTVGMNMCSLWRTGSHVGWDCVTPYPETRPVLGYYDEGIPEVADWEIRFMLEHGVDFQLYCWYSSASDGPIKDTRLSEAIHDGYFNCKYKNLTHFALLWEAMNAAHPKSSEAFRNYFVPYWIEHFFSDSQYMRIDNRAVMAVFGSWQLMKDFGGPEGVKRELDYLRDEVKKLGYDDLIILSCGGPSDSVRDAGFDAAYAYNWGKSGCSADYTAAAIRSQLKSNLLHVVPTASTGFNNVSWAETRSELITPEDFRRLHTVFRDEFLPSFADRPEWTRRFVMLSNWNEYGEGTYLMPCEKLHGFGYLDVIRDIYTDGEKEHTDLVPTKNQLSRLSTLYPQERKMLRTQGYYKAPEPDTVLRSFTWGKLIGQGGFGASACEASLTADGHLKGFSNGADPNLYVTRKLSLPMKGVTHVRIRGKVSTPTTIEIFYLSETGPSWTQAQSFGVQLAPGKESAIAAVTRQPNLDSPITALRCDPCTAPGIDFEMIGFELLKDSRKPVFLLDGEPQPLNTPIREKDGYTLFPFNPTHIFFNRLGLYYEYIDAEKKLSFFSKDAGIVFFLGQRTAVINGEKTLLDLPIETEDGLPLLPLEVMAKVFGFRFRYKAPKLTITTK